MQPQPTVEHSLWPFRMALATVLAAIPLVFFGGSVTSLNAGMAVDGWWVVERGRGDWFMWSFPIDQWLRDTGTFVEHSHRLFGSLVGFLSILTVWVAWKTRARVIALLGLLAVIGQGTIGGFRVLENSPDLAFLHGSVGQGVFALLVMVCVACSRSFQCAPGGAAAATTWRVRTLAMVTTLVIYTQIVVGAWLRHGESMAALLTHGGLVVAVIAAVLMLAKAQRNEPETSPLRKLPRWLFTALVVQILLGVAAFLAVYMIVGRNPETIHAALMPTLHVMGGAVLLACSASSWLWAHRLCSTKDRAPDAELAAAGGHA
jgi:cytochrome c oxidase assembly protein subunit 15